MLEKIWLGVGIIFTLGVTLTVHGPYNIIPTMMSYWNADPTGQDFEAFSEYLKAWAMTKEPVK